MSVPKEVSNTVSVAMAFMPDMTGGPTGSAPVAPPPVAVDSSNASFMSETSISIRCSTMSAPKVNKVTAARPMRVGEHST